MENSEKNGKLWENLKNIKIKFCIFGIENKNWISYLNKEFYLLKKN